MPSALWDSGGFGSIRWSPEPPDANCETVYGFKWDEAMQDLSPYRERYLQELLRMGLPADPRAPRCPRRPSVSAPRLLLPLAFNYGQRSDYRSMLYNLRSWLAAEAGLDSDIFTINESMASLRALGTFRPNDVFLIADMGGHTLDIALYTHQSEAEQVREEGIHQIGSLDFGGEAFLAGVLQAQHPQTPRRDMGPAYWRLRDRLSNPAERGAFARDQAFLNRMDRFHILALEFLRTMAEAWLRDKPDTARVDILLAGNGWRLRELARPDGDPRVGFGEYFEDRVAAFAKPGVRHMVRNLEGVEHTKHWVAVGALNVAIHSSRRELKETPFLAKLPRRPQPGHRTAPHRMVGKRRRRASPSACQRKSPSAARSTSTTRAAPPPPSPGPNSSTAPSSPPAATQEKKSSATKLSWKSPTRVS